MKENAEPANNVGGLFRWISLIRRIAAWTAIIAFVSFLIPHILIERFEPAAWKWATGAPRPPEWQLQWRYISLVVLMIAATISFPRWQSLLTLGITIFLICYAACGV